MRLVLVLMSGSGAGATTAHGGIGLEREPEVVEQVGTGRVIND